MRAKDYRICTALFNAYIAKPSKKEIGTMCNDRREISEEEILNLIDWWVTKKVEETGEKVQTITLKGSPILEIKRLD